MSQYSDYDNDIDWDEAILAADALDFQRSSNARATADLPETQGGLGLGQQTDELLLLYDILAREDASLSAFPDIEDLGMNASTGRKAAKTLYEQFRRKRGFLSVTDLSELYHDCPF